MDFLAKLTERPTLIKVALGGAAVALGLYGLKPIAPLHDLYLNQIGPLSNWLGTSIPPGPKCTTTRVITNIQKCGTGAFVLACMYKFDNWSLTPYVYLSLHGTYGLVWLLKECLFPDPQWQRKITIPSSLFSFFSVLGPYWLAGYFTVKNGVELTPLEICCCVTVHTLGIVFMMGADCQKFYTLKYRDTADLTKMKAAAKLIDEGYFARTRNPNYLGEMMIYGTYAYIAKHAAPWGVLAWVWSVLFLGNMTAKDDFLRTLPGWDAYRAKTGFLFPKCC